MSNSAAFLNDAFSKQINRIERKKPKHGSRKLDSERYGRDVEPAFAVPAALKDPERVNMSWPERAASMAAGVGLIAYGVSKHSWAGVGMAAAGLSLIVMGKSGHCPVYRAMKVNTAFESGDVKGVHVEQAITIDASAGELYGFWRNFENHALISEHLDSVRVTGPSTSHWVSRGPADSVVEWDAETINDRPNELIAWQTLPGSDIEHAGSVRFKPAADGDGTEVTVAMQYYPPAGSIGASLASLIHWDPAEQTADMLQRLKLLMETDRLLSPGRPVRKRQPKTPDLRFCSTLSRIEPKL